MINIDELPQNADWLVENPDPSPIINEGDPIVVFSRWMCRSCQHLRQEADFPPTCDAFPRGIPMDIVTGQFDHRRLHPSQKNEILWEQKEGEIP